MWPTHSQWCEVYYSITANSMNKIHIQKLVFLPTRKWNKTRRKLFKVPKKKANNNELESQNSIKNQILEAISNTHLGINCKHFNCSLFKYKLERTKINKNFYPSFLANKIRTICLTISTIELNQFYHFMGQ